MTEMERIHQVLKVLTDFIDSVGVIGVFVIRTPEGPGIASNRPDLTLDMLEEAHGIVSDYQKTQNDVVN